MPVVIELLAAPDRADPFLVEALRMEPTAIVTTEIVRLVRLPPPPVTPDERARTGIMARAGRCPRHADPLRCLAPDNPSARRGFPVGQADRERDLALRAGVHRHPAGAAHRPAQRGCPAGFRLGFLGAHTTFSTYEFESNQLLSDGQWLLSSANLLGSAAAGLLAVRLGIVLARRFET